MLGSLRSAEWRCRRSESRYPPTDVSGSFDCTAVLWQYTEVLVRWQESIQTPERDVWPPAIWRVTHMRLVTLRRSLPILDCIFINRDVTTSHGPQGAGLLQNVHQFFFHYKIQNEAAPMTVQEMRCRVPTDSFIAGIESTSYAFLLWRQNLTERRTLLRRLLIRWLSPGRFVWPSCTPEMDPPVLSGRLCNFSHCRINEQVDAWLAPNHA